MVDSNGICVLKWWQALVCAGCAKDSFWEALGAEMDNPLILL